MKAVTAIVCPHSRLRHLNADFVIEGAVVHNTGEVLFRVGANTGRKGIRNYERPGRRARPRLLADRQATREIASGSKPGIDATKKISGEGLKRPGRR